MLASNHFAAAARFISPLKLLFAIFFRSSSQSNIGLKFVSMLVGMFGAQLKRIECIDEHLGKESVKSCLWFLRVRWHYPEITVFKQLDQGSAQIKTVVNEAISRLLQTSASNFIELKRNCQRHFTLSRTAAINENHFVIKTILNQFSIWKEILTSIQLSVELTRPFRHDQKSFSIIVMWPTDTTVSSFRTAKILPLLAVPGKMALEVNPNFCCLDNFVWVKSCCFVCWRKIKARGFGASPTVDLSIHSSHQHICTSVKLTCHRCENAFLLTLALSAHEWMFKSLALTRWHICASLRLSTTASSKLCS